MHRVHSRRRRSGSVLVLCRAARQRAGPMGGARGWDRGEERARGVAAGPCVGCDGGRWCGMGVGWDGWDGMGCDGTGPRACWSAMMHAPEVPAGGAKLQSGMAPTSEVQWRWRQRERESRLESRTMQGRQRACRTMVHTGNRSGRRRLTGREPAPGR